MQPLVIIPARGGSKGVPGKNIKVLNGKPLIMHTVDEALQVFPKERIIVTTDCQDTIKIVEERLPVPFVRPEELSTDTSSSYDVILHAMDYAQSSGIDYDVVILLQPTSPFRSAKSIKEAMDMYTDDIDMVVSVKTSKANPYFTLFEENEEGFLQQSKSGNFTRRQDAPEIYEYNGAIYVMNAESLRSNAISKFKRVRKYRMSQYESLDIDTPLDWIIAESVVKEKSM